MAEKLPSVSFPLSSGTTLRYQTARMRTNLELLYLRMA